MSHDPLITIAATPRGWAARLHAHAVDHGGVVVRATVLTAADAVAEQAAVLVVDDITSFLTPLMVQQVRDSGRAVLGVYDPEDPHGKGVLVEAGVDALMPTDAEAEELIGAIRGLAARPDAVRAAVASPTSPPPVASAGEPGVGRVVGVVGAGGGVGTSEIALAIGDAFARGGLRSLVIDADELAGSFAPRLRLPLLPNLHTAVDAVSSGGDLADAAHHLSRRRPLWVIPGLPLTPDWAMLRRDALDDLVTAGARTAERVVLDLGRLPDPAESSLGLRYGHAAGLLAHCDEVVVLATAEPVSVVRAIAAAARVADLRSPVHLALNRLTGSRFMRDEAVAELRRATGATVVHCLPEDPRVTEAAWEGTVVASGRFVRAVRPMAAALCQGRRSAAGVTRSAAPVTSGRGGRR